MDGAASASAGQFERSDRREIWFGLALSLLACLPVLVAKYPQMGDYPAHLGRFRVMLDGGADPFLSRYYGFEWQWTGNLGSDLLIWPLAAIFGLETGGRIIAALIPLLTGLGILSVCQVIRGRLGLGGMLAFAFIWSPALLLGFLNFTLSLALALLAFALWAKLAGKAWRWALFLPVGVAVWLCHVAGWGILGILVFGYEWNEKRDWKAFVAPWPLALPFIPILAGAGSNGLVSYGDDVLTYKVGTWLKAMQDQLVQLDLLSVAAVIAIVVVAATRMRIDGRLGWAALILIVLTLLMPRHIFGGDYADLRLVPAGLMVACLAIDWPVPRWSLWLAASLFVARLAATTVAWQEDSRTMGEILEDLDALPQGARVATAIPVSEGDWRLGRFEHVGAYAVIRKSALENSNFALADIHMLSLREPGYSFADPSHRILYRQGEAIDLADFAPASRADYLWYIGEIEPDSLPPDAQVIHRTPHSFLARLAKRPADR